jgi:hypothetical protein
MVAPLGDGRTRLFFGSVVNPAPSRAGRLSIGRKFGVMLAFH